MSPLPYSSETILILKDVLSKKVTRNPAFSLRAFARDLGVSHTYLSLILNGKKPLPVAKAIQFSQVLRLTDQEAHALVEAARQETHTRLQGRTKGPRVGRVLDRAVLHYFEIEADQFKILDLWYHLPILDLTTTTHFRSDVNWIAGRLKLTVDQVANAIERLLRVGMLVEEDGKWVKSKKHIHFTEKASSQVIRSYHQQMIGKTLEALESIEDEDIQARYITTSTIAVNPDRVSEAKIRIQKFQKSLRKFLTEGGDCTELYLFNQQLVPLTSKANQKKTAKHKNSQKKAAMKKVSSVLKSRSKKIGVAR